MVINQAYLFLIFTLNGFAIGLLFDFFRILRKSFKTSDTITYIEDILFWVISGLSILYSIFMFNNGEIRIYMFLAIFIGISLYILLLSNYIIKINVYLISKLKLIFKYIFNILIIPIKIIFNILRKIFFKPISFICINFKNSIKNLNKILEKLTFKSKKIFNNIKTPKNKQEI